MRRGIGRLRAGGSGIDSDVLAWATAATANGGTYDAATLAAMSSFVKTLKAGSVWTKINRINLFAGNDLAAALVPLKVGGGSATDTNTNFVGGDYSLTTGLTGNGTNKSLATGLSILSLNKADFGMGTWTRTNPVEVTARCDIGSSYAATGITDRFYNFTRSTTTDGQAGMGSLPTNVAGWNTTGLLSQETAGTTTQVVWANGSILSNLATWNNQGPQAGTVQVFMGAGGFFSNHALNGYYIGNALDQATLSSAWAAFNSALGR